MSPDWRREDTEELKESRRVQAELAESAAILSNVSQRLLALVAELNAELDEKRSDRE